MKLTRFAYSPEGTFGKLEVGGRTFYTVEPPWADNEPFESCIPEGRYGISKDLTGEFRGFQLSNVPGRTEIEMHVGNVMGDTEGCLCPGLGLGCVRGHWAVVNSKAAMRELKQVMANSKDTTITISSVFAGKGATDERVE